MKEKPTTREVMDVLLTCWKIGVSESGVANAIAAVPDADPMAAAYDLVAWAEGAKGDSFSAGPMLLRFMREQVKRNPKPSLDGAVRQCAGCRDRFHRNQLDQGRCDPCYDDWADRVQAAHDHTSIAYYDRVLGPRVQGVQANGCLQGQVLDRRTDRVWVKDPKLAELQKRELGPTPVELDDQETTGVKAAVEA